MLPDKRDKAPWHMKRADGKLAAQRRIYPEEKRRIRAFGHRKQAAFIGLEEMRGCNLIETHFSRNFTLNF